MTSTQIRPATTEDPIKEIQKSIVDNLQKALALLSERGVGRGAMWSAETNRFCSLGAIAKARTGQSDLWVEAIAMSDTNDWPEVVEIAQTIRSTASPNWLKRRRDDDDFKLVYQYNDDNPGGVKKIFRDTIDRLS